MNFRIPKYIESKLLKWINTDRPLPLQIDITNFCNLKCIHCYHPHHKNEGSLNLKQWFQILDEYDALCEKAKYRRDLIICGGEPLTSPNFNPILEYVSRKSAPYQISVLTNGILAYRVDHQLLKRFSNLMFQISLDGPEAHSHNKIRGKEAFERAIKGARHLLDHGYRVEFLAVLSQNNRHTIPAFFDLAQSIGVDRMGFTRLISEGHAKTLVSEGKDAPLLPLELKQAYTQIFEESLRTEIPTNTHAPLMHLLHPGLGIHARFGETLIIDYQGNLLASSRTRLQLGNVLQHDLESLFYNNPIKKALRKGNVKVCGKCPHYAYCGGDRSAAFAEHGDYLGPDPGCWLNLDAIQSDNTKKEKSA